MLELHLFVRNLELFQRPVNGRRVRHRCVIEIEGHISFHAGAACLTSRNVSSDAVYTFHVPTWSRCLEGKEDQSDRMASAEPLRVSAYAVRANVPVQSFAGAIDLPVVVSDRKHIVFGSPGRWVVVHDFGALVVFGPQATLEKKAVAALSALADPRDRKPTTEDFAIVVEPGTKPDARFDRLLVPELNPSIVEIIAFVVGQSVALEHVEGEIDDMLSNLERHAAGLRDTGTFHVTRRGLLKLIGAGMALGNRTVLTLAILDAPLASWNDEALDRIHTGLLTAFGIHERYRALDHKLGKVQGSLELMVDLVQHRRSLFLEGVVIFLIALEIVLAFVRR